MVFLAELPNAVLADLNRHLLHGSSPLFVALSILHRKARFVHIIRW